MKTLWLYVISISIALVMFVGYIVVRFGLKKKEKYETIKNWYVRGSLIFMVFAFITAYLLQPNAMKPYLANENTSYLAGGLINLVGVPYGNNKAANFFCLLQIIFLYPCLLGLSLIPFYPFKTGKRVAKYFFPVVSVLQLGLMFNTVNGIFGSIVFDYRSIIYAIQIGALAACSVMYAWDIWKDEDCSFKLETTKKAKTLSIIHLIVFTLILIAYTLPIYTGAALISESTSFFGKALVAWNVLDFNLAHRLFLYYTILAPVVIYFLNRGKDRNTREFTVLYITLAGLLMFSTITNFSHMFPIKDGHLTINPTGLPIHLCHTALYVTPICILTKSKRLFYFTYFINVFGALCAMLMPNYNELFSVLHPTIWEFWANHTVAFFSPLLCVALGLFEKPKFKQMLWSLLFFGIYFIFIVFANAWLSNYVNGFKPGVIGSGTDYLFINGDFILSKLGDQAKTMLNVKAEWVWGNCTFVIYPLYQVIFFVGYAAIAFGMWFIYSLFFRIADSHNELRVKLYIAKQENISFKEKQKLLEARNMEINELEAKLELIHFSKRYGNSDTLSANDVNLTVNGGDIFGYLGPNGAGKSTCIKTIIGIQPVTEGEIKVCGFDVTEQPVLSKRLIGYVPDHYALYEKLTGREYINYIADLYGVSKEDRDARIAKYVDLFELTQAFDNRMQTYSHGMKQKMTIMAALVHNPKVWILDEPLTGLDPQSIYQVKLCMINHAKEGNIVFFSSHIIDVVEKLCTRIAIIKKGHIVYENTMEGVLKEHPEGLEQFYMETIRDNGDND